MPPTAKRLAVFCGLFIATLLATGCVAPGQTGIDKRDYIDRTEREVRAELYQRIPDFSEDLAEAPGYAVFSNINVSVLLASASVGYGVAVDNDTGERTYMRMGGLGLGLGLGVKDFRALLLFDSPEVMQRFVNRGWSFGGQADAAAKAQDKGAAVSTEVALDGMRVYQLTESGIVLQATLKGTKFWKDSELNND